MGFTWQFPVVTILLVAAILAASKWAVEEVEKGNFLPGKMVGFSILGLVIALYAMSVIGLVRQKRKRSPQPSVLPPGYPGESIHCKVKILAVNNPFLIAEGWIWMDEDLLMFKGDRFDFSLRTRDFKNLDGRKLSTCKPVRFWAPKGFGPLSLKIVPSVGEKWPAESKQALESGLDRWRRAALTNRPSLLPPFLATVLHQPGPEAGITKRFLLGTVAAMIVSALFGLVTHQLFKEHLSNTSPLSFAMAFALLPVFFFITVLADAAQRKSQRKAFEKLKASGTVEMV